MDQNRLRSKVVWVSSIFAVIMLLDQFGVFGKWGTTADTIKNCVEGIATIFVVFGVLNDPTAKGRF